MESKELKLKLIKRNFNVTYAVKLYSTIQDRPDYNKPVSSIWAGFNFFFLFKIIPCII